MNERLKVIRKDLDLSQESFGESINLSRSHIASLENASRNLTDRIVSDICREFNVNEDWLRYGQGEMFIQPSEFSLNEYAEKKNLSELEFDLIKGYMDLSLDARREIMAAAKSIINKHSEVAATKEDYIDEELENYRLELIAEQKGEISSVSEDTEEKAN